MKNLTIIALVLLLIWLVTRNNYASGYTCCAA